MEDKFFCIMLLHKDTRRGYVYENIKKELHLSPKWIEECKRFKTSKEAMIFGKEKNITKGGWTLHIRTEKDIQKEIEKDKREGSGYYRIVNDLGQSACYDSKKKQYYWKNSELECAAWQNQQDAENFIPKMRQYFPMMRFSAKPRVN